MISLSFLLLAPPRPPALPATSTDGPRPSGTPRYSKSSRRKPPRCVCGCGSCPLECNYTPPPLPPWYSLTEPSSWPTETPFPGGPQALKATPEESTRPNVTSDDPYAVQDLAPLRWGSDLIRQFRKAASPLAVILPRRRWVPGLPPFFPTDGADAGRSDAGLCGGAACGPTDGTETVTPKASCRSVVEYSGG